MMPAEKEEETEGFWLEVLTRMKERLSPDSKVLDIKLERVTREGAMVTFITKAGSVLNRAELVRNEDTQEDIILFHLPSGRKSQVYLGEIIPRHSKSGN